MTYEQAFNIGSKIDGYIKCTYAQLFSYEHGALFSLNKPRNVVSKAREGMGANPNANVDYNVGFTSDMPVVTATQCVDDEYVPVKLTQRAAAIIAAKVSQVKPKNNWYHTYKAYQELLAGIRTGETFYVKKIAIEWIPTDGINATVIDPTTGKEIKLKDALAAAEKKVARAKALLAMAGVSIIL